MDLTDVLLQNDPGVPLHGRLAILVVIHPLPAVAFYHVPSQQAHGLVRHLALARALFDGLEVLDRILRSAETVLHDDDDGRK